MVRINRFWFTDVCNLWLYSGRIVLKQYRHFYCKMYTNYFHFLKVNAYGKVSKGFPWQTSWQVSLQSQAAELYTGRKRRNSPIVLQGNLYGLPFLITRKK